MSRAKFSQFFVLVVMLATFATSVFGQPPTGGQTIQPPGQSIDRQVPDNQPGEAIGPPQGDNPAEPVQAPRETAQQPDPRPTPATAQAGNSYSDGLMEAQQKAWAQHRATGPAYTQPQQVVVNRFIQSGMDPDRVFSRFEDRFIKTVRVVKRDSQFEFLEPEARNAKDRRLNRKLVFDLACEKNFLRVVALGKEKNGTIIYQTRFRTEKKDEIVGWLVTEASIDVTTSLQMTFRNFIIDDFEPLKQQVATNTKDIAQLKADVLALQESTGTAPGVLPKPVTTTTNQTVATNTTTNSTSDANGTTSNTTSTNSVSANTTSTSGANGTTGNATTNVNTAPSPSETPMLVGDIVVAPRTPTPTPTPDVSKTPEPTKTPKASEATKSPEVKRSPNPVAMAVASPSVPTEGWFSPLLLLGILGGVATCYGLVRLARAKLTRKAAPDDDAPTPPGAAGPHVVEGVIVDDEPPGGGA